MSICEYDFISKRLTVDSVCCFREGTLKIGDRILAINGVNVTGSTLAEAMMMLRNCEIDVLLLIEYDVSVMGK